jgi:hypothetical protein
LSSPRRIAVVILAGLVGWLLQQFAGVANAVLPAVLIGMFVALLVPAKGACPVPGRSVGVDGPDGR